MRKVCAHTVLRTGVTVAGGGTMGKFRLHSLSGRRDRPRAHRSGKCL